MDRFMSKCKIDHESNCWLWQRPLQPSGYGTFWLDGKTRRAHRASWMIHCGAIPDGMLVCHRCDRPSCVNPDHLFLGSPLDNMQDKTNKGRSTHGEQQWCSKLTDELVSMARRRFASGESSASIARDFGVHRGTVARAVTGRRWKHLDEPAAPKTQRLKIKDEDVRAIRESDEPQSVLAARFGVSQPHISKIKNSKRRK